MVSRFFDYDDRPSTADDASLLPQWTDTEWDVLVGVAERLRFHAGSTVVAAGSADTSLLVVLDGTVEVRVSPQRRFPLSAGALIGEVSFFDRGGRSADVVATTDAELLRISEADVEQLAARHPGLALELLQDLGRILAIRLRRAERLAREER